MTEEEKYLPKDILDKAIIAGKEYAWRQKDFRDTVIAAKSVGLGIIGGQVQFQLPDGTCELYWRSYDTTSREAGESWKQYCDRTANECLNKFDIICNTIDLIKEGQENFQFLRDKVAAGVDISKHLIFILYFNDSETELEQIEKNVA